MTDDRKARRARLVKAWSDRSLPGLLGSYWLRQTLIDTGATPELVDDWIGEHVGPPAGEEPMSYIAWLERAAEVSVLTYDDAAGAARRVQDLRYLGMIGDEIDRYYYPSEPEPEPEPVRTHATLSIPLEYHPDNPPYVFPFKDAELRVGWLTYLAYADDATPGTLMTYAEWLDAEVDITLDTMKDIAEEEEDGLEGVMYLHAHLRAVRAEARYLAERAEARGDGV